MDEVLASLQRGHIQLRKVPRAPAPGTDLMTGLMTAIRHGVTLKKVSRTNVELRMYIQSITFVICYTFVCEINHLNISEWLRDNYGLRFLQKEKT